MSRRNTTISLYPAGGNSYDIQKRNIVLNLFYLLYSHGADGRRVDEVYVDMGSMLYIVLLVIIFILVKIAEG